MQLPSLPSLPNIPSLPSVPNLPSVPGLEILNASKAPAFSISVDGIDVKSKINSRLISLTLTDNKGPEADRLDLVLDDADGALPIPPRGAEVRVSIGWEGEALVDKGSFTIDEVNHSGAPDKLTIRARSADMRTGITTPRERSWDQTKLGDMIKTIAGENDLIPVIASALVEKLIEHIDQVNESTANLLNRVAGMFDAIWSIKDGRLLFLLAAAGVTASGKKLERLTIKRSDGDNHEFSVADRHTYTHVKAVYNDLDKAEQGFVIWGPEEDAAENSNKRPPATKKPESKKPYIEIKKTEPHRAKAQRLAKKEWKRVKSNNALAKDYDGVTVPYKDANLGVSGVVSWGKIEEEAERQHAQKLAERDASKASSNEPPAVAIEPSADNVLTLRHTYATQENAKRAARTRWRQIQRGVATFSLTLDRGNPRVIPELPITLKGWKQEIDSTDWIAGQTVHTLTETSFTTRVEMEIQATEIPG